MKLYIQEKKIYKLHIQFNEERVPILLMVLQQIQLYIQEKKII